MNTPTHPELRRLAWFLPQTVVGPRRLPVLRRLDELVRRRTAPGVEVETAGELTVRIHRPPTGTPEPCPALLWIHGGGYVMGTPNQDDSLCALLAERVGAVVAAVDHRLAPEHPFPTPLHDCHEALVWLAGRADVDAGRVAIGGASAGGGLAAALALLARDRGEVAPCLQLLTYPMLDDRTVLRRDIDQRRYRLWNNRSNRFGWRSYLGTDPGGPGVSGLAAPARAEDLTGLAPAWIGVGTNDLFLDEDVAYAERLRAAGVPCETVVVDGAFHGFDGLAPKAGVTHRFRESQIQALTAALAP